jgi:hypothetical protein
MRPFFRSALGPLVALFIVIALALLLQTPASKSSVMEVFFLGATVALALGAGALAVERESGMAILDQLHGASAAELTLGVALQVTTLVLVAFTSAALLVFGRSPSIWTPSILVSLAVAALGLVAFVSLLVLFGALIRGSGNSALVVALVLLSGSARSLQTEPIPAVIANAIAIIHELMPLGHQVADFARNAQADVFDFGPVAVLAGSIPVIVGLTVLIVSRSELAMAWRR